MSSISGGPPPSSELSSAELYREMLALSDQLGQLSQFSREKLVIPKHGAAEAGVCVFHLAVLSGNERVIQEVEQVFPDLILKPTREGETAIFYACFISKSSKQLARLVDLAQRYHPQPLQYAQELVSKQRAFPISLLLSILYPEPCRPSGSWTRWLSTEAYPLSGVKMEQRFDIARYIIRIWPESVAQLREHLTKEHIINSYLCYNIIKIGLGDQVLKGLVNREQRTPVHDFFIQTRIGQVEHLKAFAEAGIDLTSEDRNSYIPLEYANITKDGASRCELIDTYLGLVPKDALPALFEKTNPILKSSIPHRAVKLNKIQLVKIFIKHGAKMSAPNPKNDGRNAFFYLPDKSPEMVKLLLDTAAGEGERGIETALTAVDTESKESLACELASRGESWLIFQQLAEAGWLGHLDLETPDSLGCTPLQKAYRTNSAGNVRYLLRLGARPTTTLIRRVVSDIMNRLLENDRRWDILKMLLAVGSRPDAAMEDETIFRLCPQPWSGPTPSDCVSYDEISGIFTLYKPYAPSLEELRDIRQDICFGWSLTYRLFLHMYV